MDLITRETETKSKINKINTISFYDWCYKNLPKEEADKIMLRWDYEKNNITPNEVNYCSMGKKRKGYWFKCLDNLEHDSELKDIRSFTNGCKGSISCVKCNSVYTTHHHLVKFFKNKEDALKYSSGSNKKVLMICPNCGYEKEKSVHNLVAQGFGCPKCSDGVSYPEKFVFNVLEQLIDKNFTTQLTKTIFKWCKNYRYDFYIGKINCIIETHGSQHYEETKENYFGFLLKTQKNDKQKELLAKQNGIEHYIVLDCRKSELEWIRNSIMNSDLPTLLNFKESDIDWLKCHEYACCSLVKVVCKLWNDNNKVIDIVNKIKINETAIRRYLKQGEKLGWYVYKKPKKENLKKGDYKKKVVCITTNEIFNSQSEASKKYNVDSSSISKCCRKERFRSIGKHPITNEPLRWMYYDEYIKLQPNT